MCRTLMTRLRNESQISFPKLEGMLGLQNHHCPCPTPKPRVSILQPLALQNQQIIILRQCIKCIEDSIEGMNIRKSLFFEKKPRSGNSKCSFSQCGSLELYAI